MENQEIEGHTDRALVHDSGIEKFKISDKHSENDESKHQGNGQSHESHKHWDNESLSIINDDEEENTLHKNIRDSGTNKLRINVIKDSKSNVNDFLSPQNPTYGNEKTNTKNK